MAAKYSETITTLAGTVLANVKVQALDGNGVAQTLYTDVGLTTASTPESTAVYSNEEGLAEFYIADGTYTIVHTYRSTTKTFANVELYDLSNLKQLSTDLASTASGDGAGRIGYLYSSTYADDTVGSKLQQSVNLDDFPGATDHAKMVAAAAYCASAGAALYLPAREIDIDSDLGSITLNNIAIYGSGVHDGVTTAIDVGSYFFITGTTNSPFKVKRGVVLDGVGGWYPNQTDSATPTAYPDMFDFDFASTSIQYIYVRNCVIVNAYNFMNINDSGGSVGHLWIENNKIGAINRGIYLANNTEHIQIKGNEFTFGGWTQATEAGAKAYSRANCINIQIDDSDGVEIIGNLFFGSLYGVKIAGTGSCNNMDISHNKFDQVRYGIAATGSGSFSGIISTNTFNAFNSQNTTLQGRSISFDTSAATRGTITIFGNTFALATEDHIYVSGNTANRDIVVGPNNYLSWAAYKSSGTYGAINVSGSLTKITVTGGHFYGGNSAAYSYGIMGAPQYLTLSGAAFFGTLAPLNITSATTVTTSGNWSASTGGTYSNNITATNLFENDNWDKPKPYSVASATALDITGLGDFITVTGTTNITSITGGARVGRVIRLLFSGVLTFTDGSNLKLNGNFTTSADDIITLISDGTNWYETGRSAN